MLEIDLTNAITEIKKLKAKTVAIQIPEGLKTKLTGIMEEIELKTKAKTIGFVEPCFGACDLADEKALSLGADLLIHFGHSKMIQSSISTIYLPLAYEVDIFPLVEKLSDFLNENKIESVALTATIQFIEFLPNIKKELEHHQIKVLIGKGNKRISKAGQVLGCNFSAVSNLKEKFDAVVFFGDGLFHPLGLSFASNKRIIVLNPLSERVFEFREGREEFLRKRFGLIKLAMEAQSFGILVSLKRGQLQLKKAFELKQIIEKANRKAFIFVSELIKPEYFMGLKIDCFVNTACPRIALDDYLIYNKPLLNPKEIEIALAGKTFKEFELNELI